MTWIYNKAWRKAPECVGRPGASKLGCPRGTHAPFRRVGRGEPDGGLLLGAMRAPEPHRSIDHKFGAPAFKRNEDAVMIALPSTMAGNSDALRRFYTAVDESTNALGKMNGFYIELDANILIYRHNPHTRPFLILAGRVAGTATRRVLGWRAVAWCAQRFPSGGSRRGPMRALWWRACY